MTAPTRANGNQNDRSRLVNRSAIGRCVKNVVEFATVAALVGGCVSDNTSNGSGDGGAEGAAVDNRLKGPYISADDKRTLCNVMSEGIKDATYVSATVAMFDDIEDEGSFCEIEVSFAESPPLLIRVKFKEYSDDNVESYQQYRESTADGASYAKSECGIYTTLGAATLGSGNFSAESSNIDGSNGQFCALDVYSGTTATFFTRQKTMVSMEYLVATDVSDGVNETPGDDETQRLEELRNKAVELSLDSI